MEEVICINKAVKDCLECPVCCDYFIPPIYECVSGHSICSVCTNKVKNCPECRLQITPIRNLSLERIISSLDIKCRFSGCSLTVLLSRRLLHEKTCIYNPNLLCLFKGCEWEGINLVKHLINVHKCKEFLIDSKSTVRGWNSKVWKNADWGFSIWNFNETFIINQSYSDNNFFYLWTFDLGKERIPLSLTIGEGVTQANFSILTSSLKRTEKNMPLHISIDAIENYFLVPAEGFDVGYKRLSIKINLN